MFATWSFRARQLSFLLLGLLVICALGCGGKASVPLVPVSGTVKLGGTPMSVGTVEFHPDEGKGNTYKGRVTGMIKGDGKYSLSTEGRDGAPVGWYKVTVTGQGMPEMGKMGGDTKAPPPPAVPPRYTKADSTNFSIEVTDGAPTSAYDLSLAK